MVAGVRFSETKASGSRKIQRGLTLSCSIRLLKMTARVYLHITAPFQKKALAATT
jgi:hypothetical protein